MSDALLTWPFCSVFCYSANLTKFVNCRKGSYISVDDSSYDDDSDYDSRDDYDKNGDTEGSDDEDDEDYDYVPFKLPNIGYPKTPSLPRSSQSSLSFRSRFSDVPDSLPEVPGSRQITGMRTADSKRLMTTQVRQALNITMNS